MKHISKLLACALALTMVLCLCPVSTLAAESAYLDGLTVSGANLSPSFKSSRFNYTISVEDSNIYVPLTLNLTLAEPTDTVRAIRTGNDDEYISSEMVNGNSVLFPCDPYTLNTMTLTVSRAGAGDVTYTIVCDRRQPEKSNVYESIDEKKEDDENQPTNVVEYITGTSYVVVCRALNVRSTAGTEIAPVGKLYRGQSVIVSETQGEWAKISYNGKISYVYKKYLDR